MKIFIDTAKIDEIKEAISWGIVDGVTTNPSLIKQAVDDLRKNVEGVQNMRSYIKDILMVVDNKPVSLEVVSVDEKQMYAEAKRIHDIFCKEEKCSNVVVKIPINTSSKVGASTAYDGLKVMKKLSDEEILVNCTLIMTPEQAMLAAKAGARYVSPFAGRIDDSLRTPGTFKKEDYYPGLGINGKEDNGILSGVDLVSKVVHIFKNYNYYGKCEIIAASIRNPRQVREIALAGADIATVPFSVLREMIYHPKTAEGIEKFLADVVPEYKTIFE